MIGSTGGNRKGLFSTNYAGRTGVTQNLVGDSPISEGKRIVAAKIASSVVGGGGAPIRVINAFLQVRDYQGLDRYLGKHKIPTDLLTSSLQKAAMTSDIEAVDVFAKHGANVNFVDQFGTTLLHFAMRGGGDEKVIKSLVAHGLDYSSWRMDGLPLLHWACSMGFLQLVQ
ncbi:Transient receptor potential cation channel subfamily M member 7 [Fasciolopsis buskii]|uniref:Transient receptor potential cation channel subfamily M member 7 n=1 Tax=Fasciolopsis buskii TaxID=27845 RepID=A0A8E0VFX0_9TREM|nr:Transient receptor potential cation channel subfamily M member 7 [Fasciolopsis buski]